MKSLAFMVTWSVYTHLNIDHKRVIYFSEEEKAMKFIDDLKNAADLLNMPFEYAPTYKPVELR